MTRIYFINIDGETERRAFMERQLRQLGIEAERFAAITNPTLVRDPSRLLKGRGPLTPGERGCLESHAALWANCARGTEPVMVLEDDVLLSSRLPNLLSSIDGLNPDEVDIVRLETTRSVGRFGRSKTLENFTLRRVMQPQFCSGAYIIYPKAAEYLLTEIHGNPSNTPVDLVLFDRPSIFQLGIWQALPGLAVQPEFLPAAASAMPHHLSSLSNERVAVIEVAGLGRSTFYERAANWGRLLGRYSLEDLFAFRKPRSVEYQP